MAQNGFNRRSSNNEPFSRTTFTSRNHPGAATRINPSSATSTSAAIQGDGNLGLRNFNQISLETDRSVGASLIFVPPLSPSPNAPHRTGSGNHTRHSPAPDPLMSPVIARAVNSSSTSPATPSRTISLDQPRPTSERHRNAYLAAPVLSQRGDNSRRESPNSLLRQDGVGGGNNGINNLNNPRLSPRHHQSSSGTLNNFNFINNSEHAHRVFNSSLTAAEQVRLPTNSKSSKKVVNNNLTSSKSSSKFSSKSPSGRSSQLGDEDDEDSHVVTSQPTKRSLLGDNSGLVNAGVVIDDNGGKVKLAESTIVCPYCRKCRCEACATPRPLPSRWICSQSIHCGPEPLLDYVTCLCCVKALFYHCGKNHEPDDGVLCADKPCSCAPHRKFWRWGCLAAMSLVLPCLCLYWPCRGCINVAEKTYQHYHSNGCTCQSSGASPVSSSGPQLQLSQNVPDRHHLHHNHQYEPPHSNDPPEVTSRIAATKLLPSVYR